MDRTPSALEALLGLAGTWQATYELRGDPSFDSDTPSTATVAPLLGGRFVRIEYTWDEADVLREHGPQSGLLIVGHDAATDRVTVVWLDSWHNGERTAVCDGSLLPNGGVDVFTTYPGGPDSPDWGWRTVIEPAEDSWLLTMFNVTPAGDEALAVRAAYRRDPAAGA